MIKDYDLKVLSDESYSVDSKKAENDVWKEGEIIIDKKLSQPYRIFKTSDSTSNGMQAMAVAPIKNGKTDTSEIVIAYAGTNFSDKLDLYTDFQSVGLGNKESLYELKQVSKKTIPIPIPVANSQIITAEKFAEDIQTDYPNAEVTTTGHSLGEYLALYVSAEKGWANVGFNDPDPYDVLSPEAKKRVKENSHMLFNYRNKADILGNFGGNGTGAGIPVDMDMAEMISREELKNINMIDLLSKTDVNDLKGIIDSHRLSVWEFDKDGNVAINSSYDNRTAIQIQSEKNLYAKMAELSLLANKLKASRGGLSSNGMIFLNSSQTLLTVEHITESTKVAIESIVNIYKQAIDELEEIWEKNILIAQSIGTSLSYGEVLEALESGGVTKYSFVFEPMAYYREKITDALKIGESFDNLASDIKESIEKIIETDEKLADRIAQGV